MGVRHWVATLGAAFARRHTLVHIADLGTASSAKFDMAAMASG